MKAYEIITSKICEQLEKGVIPWRKPWGGATAINYETRKQYSFLNTMLLSEPGEYLTFNQVQKLKGRIKKGAKASQIFFTSVTKRVEEVDGETEEKEIKFLKYYNVFHIKDCEGIESKLTLEEKERNQTAEQIVNAYSERANIKIIRDTLTNKACYYPSTDLIRVPMIEQYNEVEKYYSTLFHEMTHSTGAAHRLNRDLSGTFGTKKYAREELVAEMGAAMLCGVVGIENVTLDNSAAYIQSWLKALNDDKTLITWAASRAEKAVNYIRG